MTFCLCVVSKVNLIAEQVQKVEHRPKALKIHLGRLERFLYYSYLGSCSRQKIIRRESISPQLDRYVKSEINFSFYNKLLQILFEIDLPQISLPQNCDKIETKKGNIIPVLSDWKKLNYDVIVREEGRQDNDTSRIFSILPRYTMIQHCTYLVGNVHDVHTHESRNTT